MKEAWTIEVILAINLKFNSNFISKTSIYLYTITKRNFEIYPLAREYSEWMKKAPLFDQEQKCTTKEEFSKIKYFWIANMQL